MSIIVIIIIIIIIIIVIIIIIISSSSRKEVVVVVVVVVVAVVAVVAVAVVVVAVVAVAGVVVVVVVVVVVLLLLHFPRLGLRRQSSLWGLLLSRRPARFAYARATREWDVRGRSRVGGVASVCARYPIGTIRLSVGRKAAVHVHMADFQSG